ncbi:hypothetical protein [Streptomyces phaeoluteigriseus]|nr:hypothetical protein [Streptomyces phaeoluteigriseus]
MSGKQAGDPVLSGDTIHLRNLFGTGSHLDVFTRTTASTSM